MELKGAILIAMGREEGKKILVNPQWN
jgi:hypothetical protein